MPEKILEIKADFIEIPHVNKYKDYIRRNIEKKKKDIEKNGASGYQNGKYLCTKPQMVLKEIDSLYNSAGKPKNLNNSLIFQKLIGQVVKHVSGIFPHGVSDLIASYSEKILSGKDFYSLVATSKGAYKIYADDCQATTCEVIEGEYLISGSSGPGSCYGDIVGNNIL